MQVEEPIGMLFSMDTFEKPKGIIDILNLLGTITGKHPSCRTVLFAEEEVHKHIQRYRIRFVRAIASRIGAQ